MSKEKCNMGSENVEWSGVTGSQSTLLEMEEMCLTLYGEDLSLQCLGVTILFGEQQICEQGSVIIKSIFQEYLSEDSFFIRCN